MEKKKELTIKTNQKICITPGCYTVAKHGKYCYRCSSQRFRTNNKIKYAFNNLKYNAKRRNKSFDLLFKEFKDFCKKTDYINLKGRKHNSMSIDRINPELGYEKGNIRMITNSENIKLQLALMYSKKKKKTNISKVEVPF